MIVRVYSACFMLVSGIALCIAGFCVSPVGQVSESVLVILGQCIIYAGSALGIEAYVDHKINRRDRS